MSRLDKFEEILNSYDGRKYEEQASPFVLTEKQIEMIYEGLRDRPVFAPEQKIAYLAHNKDTEFAVFVAGKSVTRSPNTADMETILSLMRRKNHDLIGLAFYTSTCDAAKFVQEGYPRWIRWVPDGIETPDLMIAVDNTGHYVIKESMDWVEGSVKK